MPRFQPSGDSEFPIVQLPAESLLCKQSPVSLSDINTSSFKKMTQRLIDTRNHYQYPSLSAPQIGWNVSVFTLYDNSVWINPQVTRVYAETPCWTWEPCASCAFLMHYIQRPHEILVSRYDEAGAFHKDQRLDGMRSRLVQHEMDHMNGVLFSRRIPDALHVVPMDGFQAMSDWADDYPSLEARSTNLYSLFFPPMKFVATFLENSELLKRHYEDNVYPGHEIVRDGAAEERNNHQELVKFIEYQKAQGLWRGSEFSRVKKRPSPAATSESPN